MFNSSWRLVDADPTEGVGATAARRSVPPQLELWQSTIPGAGLGIFAAVPIPSRTIFGPYKGIKRVGREEEEGTDYRWKLGDLGDGRVLVVDAADKENSNWMCFVNTTLDSQEAANLVAFQHEGDIFYKATRPLRRGEELLVWYRQPYPDDLITCFRNAEDDLKSPNEDDDEEGPLQRGGEVVLGAQPSQG